MLPPGGNKVEGWIQPASLVFATYALYLLYKPDEFLTCKLTVQGNLYYLLFVVKHNSQEPLKVDVLIPVLLVRHQNSH